MSAPGGYNVPLIVVEHYGGLYEVLQDGAHLVEREVRFEPRKYPLDRSLTRLHQRDPPGRSSVPRELLATRVPEVYNVGDLADTSAFVDRGLCFTLEPIDHGAGKLQAPQLFIFLLEGENALGGTDMGNESVGDAVKLFLPSVWPNGSVQLAEPVVDGRLHDSERVVEPMLQTVRHQMPTVEKGSHRDSDQIPWVGRVQNSGELAVDLLNDDRSHESRH